VARGVWELGFPWELEFSWKLGFPWELEFPWNLGFPLELEFPWKLGFPWEFQFPYTSLPTNFPRVQSHLPFPCTSMDILWERATNWNGKMEVGMTYYTCVKEVPFLHTQVTQVFIDTLAAQRPNNLIKQEKV